MLQAVVKNAGLQDRVNRMISADEVKAYKPSPIVYNQVCDKLGLETSSIGFVSSISFDVVGAKSFGFWTCRVDRQKAPLDELDVRPDIEVDTLTGLVEVLNNPD